MRWMTSSGNGCSEEIHGKPSAVVPECIVRLGAQAILNLAIGFSLLKLRSLGYRRAPDYGQSSASEITAGFGVVRSEHWVVSTRPVA